MPELNALTALALARTTGCKVRPKGFDVVFYYSKGSDSPYCRGKGGTVFCDKIALHFLMDARGEVRLWEIVEEGATP